MSIRSLLEHAGIDVAGKTIAVGGRPVDAPSRSSLLSVICRQVDDLAIRGYRRVAVELFTGWRLFRARNSSLSVELEGPCGPISPRGTRYAFGGGIVGPLHSDEDSIPAFLPAGSYCLPPGGFSASETAPVCSVGSSNAAGTGSWLSSGTATTAPGSACPEEDSMATNHGADHLDANGYCMCGCSSCVDTHKGHCVCGPCTCSAVPLGVQDFSKPYVGPNNATFTLTDPRSNQLQDAIIPMDQPNIVRGDCD